MDWKIFFVLYHLTLIQVTAKPIKPTTPAEGIQSTAKATTLTDETDVSMVTDDVGNEDDNVTTSSVSIEAEVMQAGVTEAVENTTGEDLLQKAMQENDLDVTPSGLPQNETTVSAMSTVTGMPEQSTAEMAKHKSKKTHGKKKKKPTKSPVTKTEAMTTPIEATTMQTAAQTLQSTVGGTQGLSGTEPEGTVASVTEVDETSEGATNMTSSEGTTQPPVVVERKASADLVLEESPINDYSGWLFNDELLSTDAPLSPDNVTSMDLNPDEAGIAYTNPGASTQSSNAAITGANAATKPGTGELDLEGTTINYEQEVMVMQEDYEVTTGLPGATAEGTDDDTNSTEAQSGQDLLTVTTMPQEDIQGESDDTAGDIILSADNDGELLQSAIIGGLPMPDELQLDDTNVAEEDADIDKVSSLETDANNAVREARLFISEAAAAIKRAMAAEESGDADMAQEAVHKARGAAAAAERYAAIAAVDAAVNGEAEDSEVKLLALQTQEEARAVNEDIEQVAANLVAGLV
ncbi:streptococcal hemagglutinin-like [Ptychodera flava]|uniref:streptococcal hemagglutinin-like n=1 Tax=Ptychodera flava TaxID=63121 RepID=UPI00396A0C5C